MDNAENRKQRVLVAEDVSVIAYKITKVLEDGGFSVENALDGEQCLEKIQSFKPDLIILDIMMPKINGIEILKIVKSNAETAHIGVIVCTGKGFTTEQNLVDELGAFEMDS